MPDNAVMDAPVTAAEPEAPPSLEMPETEPAPAPETEAAPETPDSGEQTDGWDGLTAEEIEARVAERVEAARKDAKARAEESHRRQLENQQAEAKAQADREAYNRGLALGSQQARQARFQQGYQALAGALKQAYDNGKDPDPQTIARVAGWLNEQAEVDTRYIAHERYSHARGRAIGAVNPDWRVSPELARELQQAQAAFDYDKLAELDVRMIEEALEQKVAAKATARATAEAAAKTAAAAKAPAPRKPAASPTGVASVGAEGRRPTTQREADAALMAARESGDRDRVSAALAVVRQSRQQNWPW